MNSHCGTCHKPSEDMMCEGCKAKLKKVNPRKSKKEIERQLEKHFG